MAETFQFELVAPDRLLRSGPVEMVVIPGEDGDFGVLNRHAAMISTIRPGVITVYENGNPTEKLFVAGGFAEVTGDRCTVLVETAETLADFDVASVSAALKNVREDLADAKNDAAKHHAEEKIKVLEEKLRIAQAKAA